MFTVRVWAAAAGRGKIKTPHIYFVPACHPIFNRCSFKSILIKRASSQKEKRHACCRPWLPPTPSLPCMLMYHSLRSRSHLSGDLIGVQPFELGAGTYFGVNAAAPSACVYKLLGSGSTGRRVQKKGRGTPKTGGWSPALLRSRWRSRLWFQRQRNEAGGAEPSLCNGAE